MTEEIRVILADDHPTMRKGLRLSLEEDPGLKIVGEASDGEAALAFVAEHRTGVRQHEPCVILLDLHLPKYNGIEVLTAIRQEPILKHIHVVVLTSDASPAEQIQVIELGGICCVKPSDLDAIKSLAEEIMALCKGLAEGIATSRLS